MRHMEVFAFVRHQRLDKNALAAAERHGKRADRTSASRLRKGAKPGDGLAFALCEDGKLRSGPDARDLRAAFKLRKKMAGAEENPRGASVLHSLIGVSPEWVKAAGGLHDPKNPRLQKLLDCAVAWADREIGGTFAGRVDLDETGGAVVDVFSAPAHRMKFGRGKEKLYLSPHRSLTLLMEERKMSRSYTASQDSWAEYAREHLDRNIRRGKPVKDSKRRHLSRRNTARRKTWTGSCASGNGP